MKTTKVISKTKKTAVTAVKKVAKQLDRYTTEVGEYNGRPTISITDTEAKNPQYGTFTFGLSKARMILGALEDIKAFVEANEG